MIVVATTANQRVTCVAGDSTPSNDVTTTTLTTCYPCKVASNVVIVVLNNDTRRRCAEEKSKCSIAKTVAKVTTAISTTKGDVKEMMMFGVNMSMLQIFFFKKHPLH